MDGQTVKTIKIYDKGTSPVFGTELKDSPGPDVCLVSEEGEVVVCHAAILAVGSPLLRNILHNLPQSDEDMARIVFSDVKLVHLSQLVEYLYTGTVQLGMQDRSEMATIISCLLIHRTFSPKEDSQIKQECEYDDEPEEDNYNESLDSDDELNLNKFESKLEEYDVKPTRISLPNDHDKKTKDNEDDDEWKPRSRYPIGDGPEDEDSTRTSKAYKKQYCDHCDFSTNIFRKLARHYRSDHIDYLEEFERKHNLSKECSYCDEKFKTLAMLKKHVQGLHKEHFDKFKEMNQVACRVCDQKFFDLDSRRVHERKVHNLKKLDKLKQDIICPVCGHQAPHRKAYSNHKVIWHREVESPCSEAGCGASFNSRWDLKLHQKEIHNRKQVRISSTNQPKQIGMNEDSGEFYCEYCGKGFNSQKQYKYHVKYHHQMNHQVKCKYCDFSANKHSIERHEALHFDPKLPCETCGKLFHHLTNLRRHQRMSHLPDSMKKHRCHICGKGFDEKPKLHEHINVHTGAKPYKCRFCDMAYQNKSNRQAHERKAHGIMNKKNTIDKISTDIKLDTETK